MTFLLKSRRKSLFWAIVPRRSTLTTRSWLLLFLILDIIGMALVAALYLRKRKLSLLEYFIWAVIALIPVLGPFLLIISGPGRSNQSQHDQFD